MTPEERVETLPPMARGSVWINKQIADIIRDAENDALEEAATYLGRFHADMPMTDCQNAIRGLKRAT